jgi:hypothetical protein
MVLMPESWGNWRSAPATGTRGAKLRLLLPKKDAPLSGCWLAVL